MRNVLIQTLVITQILFVANIYADEPEPPCSNYKIDICEAVTGCTIKEKLCTESETLGEERAASRRKRGEFIPAPTNENKIDKSIENKQKK